MVDAEFWPFEGGCLSLFSEDFSSFNTSDLFFSLDFSSLLLSISSFSFFVSFLFSLFFSLLESISFNSYFFSYLFLIVISFFKFNIFSLTSLLKSLNFAFIFCKNFFPFPLFVSFVSLLLLFSEF